MSDDFANQFLERVALARGLPYEMMAWDYHGHMGIDAKKLSRASSLVRDAMHAKHSGKRGYRRKLKRALRLQREATGATSRLWFTEQVRRAEETEIRLKAMAINTMFPVYINTGDVP